MYEDVEPLAHVYAPAGDDLSEHLKRIERFNTRPDQPTHWREQVYSQPDFFEKMLAEKPGNVVVLAGNNARKTDYILRSVKAGLNVLADKPMVINPAELPRLQEAFAVAASNHVLLYDIMTERYEITTLLQRELSRQPALFGELAKGSPDEPAIVMESIHYISKTVGGAPLKRPAWFFDPRQTGEGIADVTTHLVDLAQWEAFPERALSPDDVTVLNARRWTTPISREQFKQVTGAEDFPGFLQPDPKTACWNTVATAALLTVCGTSTQEYRLSGDMNLHPAAGTPIIPCCAEPAPGWSSGKEPNRTTSPFSTSRKPAARLIRLLQPR